MTDQETNEGLGDIAVVGMAGRFPKARNVEEFWKNLREGNECISFFHDDELIASGVDPALLRDETYVKAWGWMEGVDMFDAGFFDMTPREAEITDPQIRLLLECAWETLEDAACDPSRYPGRIGVFAGSSMMFYLWQNIAPTPGLLDSVGFVQAWIVNDRDFVATRVNYKLDLKGPGMTVQTACSTSLVATHLGIQSLLTGESDMVLCGGVSAPTPYKEGYHYMEGGTFSPDGHVRTFDAKAKGMLGGNGVALVALKRLEDAIADGDPIRAVIKGTALNNDGVDKVTYTAPSVDGQVQCILDTLDVAGVDPSSISYVEAHGTGTPLGDPIEIAALTQAWRTKTDEKQWCPIGSVKSNIGHLDTAAGVAGIVKTVLALQNKEIPPSLHYETSNPEIDFESSPFFVNTELRPWDTDRLPRRATVSSLGMGGTNSHAILEEAPEREPTSESRDYKLLCLSARSDDALDVATERLAEYLEGAGADANLADVAYTTQLGRKTFGQRCIVVATDNADAADALRTLDKKRTAKGGTLQPSRPVVFLFSGQGSQYANMARGLYESEAIFREEVDRCATMLEPHVGLDLRTLFFPEAGGEEAAAAELEKTQNTQPALFVIEYALAKLLGSWGVEPSAMLGHSIGEYVAAALAGVFSLEDALRLVAARGRLIGSLPEGGGMMAVQLPEREVKAVLPAGVSIAALNAPELTVVSGPLESLATMEKALEPRGVSTRRLHTSHAFHSSLMEPILDAFRAEVDKVQLSAPESRVVSCSTGTWLTDAEATDPDYWVRHIRDAVRFADGVQTLFAEDSILLEVGPGQTLTSLAQLTAMTAKPSATIVATTRHPRDEQDDRAVILRGLGELWMAGGEIAWEDFYGAETRRRLSLPTYPFQRRRYWIERPDVNITVAGDASAVREVKHADLEDWFYVPSWKRGAPAIPAETRERWLVFTEGGAAGLTALQKGISAGASVFSVRKGDAFGRKENVFTIDPSNPEHYGQVLDAMAEDGGLPNEIVHIWGVYGEPDPELGDTFFSLLYLAQSLSGREVEGGFRVDVVTTGAHDVFGDRPAHPERATVMGPCMTMNLELPNVTARSIDLAGTGEAELEGLASELLGATEQPVIAIVAGSRWALTHEHTHLRSAERKDVLRDGAVVLATGGLGGIATSLGEDIARVGGKLALISRSGLPARDAWDAWVSEHGDNDATSVKIANVRHLEELGAEVLVLAADSTDADAMREAVRATEERFGAIHGVVHAAGVAGAGIVELKTADGARDVLAAKVQGTRILQDLFDGKDLDFVLLCSSISSVCVGLGQIDYFAANAYMDSVAHSWRRDDDTHVVAVNWDAWSEVGMAVNTAVPDAMVEERAESLRLGIAPKEGREAFLRILGTGLPQVVVSPRELPTRADYRARFDLKSQAAAKDDASDSDRKLDDFAPARSTAPRPSLSTEYAAPTTEGEKDIAEMWADLLGIEKVGVKDNFFELGGNSLVMMQVNVRLRALYGVSLPIRELFEIPEVRLLAERMDAIRMVSEPSSPSDSSEDVEEFTL